MITCQERGVSRSRDDDRIEVEYLIRGTDDEQNAYNSLFMTAPPRWTGWKRARCHVEQTQPNVWTGTSEYRRTGGGTAPETGESRFSFETAGGTQHITQSRETIGRYAAEGETAPDFKGAIGVTHDAVEGVDIVVPVYRFTEVHYKAAVEVDSAYKATLFMATGRMNLDPFRGLKPGEVLFEGASGALRAPGEDWELSFHFAASPQRENFQVGRITVPLKCGWDYMWIRYADEEDEGAHAVVKRPAAVYLERVYEPFLFSSLEI